MTRLQKVLLLSTGWAFIVLGIVGLFLPVLQGILFLLIGLFILSSEYVWARHLLARIEKRFPGVAEGMAAASRKASRWLHRIFGRSPSEP